MNQLSDNKLSKLKSLGSQGGFWYITKQNLIFRDLCFIAKILEDWNDQKDENYQSFFDRNKILLQYGSLPSDLAHRATKNCEYIGLTVPSEKYSTQNLTPFYFAIKKLCNGDFNQLSFYPEIIDKQLERMYVDSQTNSVYTVSFQICPFMFLFKILLLIGDITGSFKISKNEFKLFVATAQSWSEYFEVVESILRYRNDADYKTQCDLNSGKVSDSRYQVLAQNHSQLEINGNDIAIRDNEIRNIRRKVAEYELSDKVQSSKDIYSAESIISISRQIIYFGAPGTGKSHEINAVTCAVEKETEDNHEAARVFRTTFHPDSDYSTFVGCYKPAMEKRPVRNVAGDIVKNGDIEVCEETIVYKFTPQSFINAYIRAWETEKPVYLVIEEINRGNCAQIFGDLFQLLDRDKNCESKYPITPNSDLRDYIASHMNNVRENTPEGIKRGEKMKLPSNLFIWATMNTSDQSLFPIDSAFKRRWDWKYKKIVNHKEEDYQIVIKEGKHYSWWQFIDKINKHIGSVTSSEDKKLGYFFVHKDDGQITADMFVNKVLFYLYNDALKDYTVGLKVKEDDKEKTASFSDFYDENGDVIEDKVIEALDEFLSEPKKENTDSDTQVQ